MSNKLKIVLEDQGNDTQVKVYVEGDVPDKNTKAEDYTPSQTMATQILEAIQFQNDIVNKFMEEQKNLLTNESEDDKNKYRN